MIHKIFSSLPSFKGLDFQPGLNVLVAEKEAGATAKQTRNGAGKTSLIELIHFLTGANAGPQSLFKSSALDKSSFGMQFDLSREEILVKRSGSQKSEIDVKGASFLKGKSIISNSEWVQHLGEKMFRLHDIPEMDGLCPNFRSLFAYFVRRQEAFNGTPEKQMPMQQTGYYQVALLYLLGLDWKVASDWQKVRDSKKMLGELKKAAKSEAFGSVIGKSSELRTSLTIATSSLQELKSQLADFRVLPQYRDLEKKADQLTQEINDLANANIVDTASIRDLEKALSSEIPPPLDDLKRIYSEAGVVLPGTAIKRYEDVQSFHQSVIRNRKDYLSEELEVTKKRIVDRNTEKADLDERRSEVMSMLKTHGALEQFSNLEAQAARKEAEIESLRQQFKKAKQLEDSKNELEIERHKLTRRLRRDFTEQKEKLSQAILAFEETSKSLYESAGNMTIEETSNGPVFKFSMQGSRSKGIKNMQFFCFDMMLMRLCSKRGIGPGFLVHDSHLFDAVDGRQVVSAMKVAAQTASELGFQYIVTMNQDDAFKETIEGFDLKNHQLPVVLTDAKEDGGLFGFRF